jgi:signal transduction histidine kinase
MTPSLTPPSQRPPDKQTVASPLGSIQWIWRDRVLRPAFLLCALLISYQLAVTLAHPPWIGPVTDWLRATLAWPELLVVVLASVWLTRHRQPGAATAWMLTIAFVSYAVARTFWTVDDQLIYHHGVPFPILPDLFFVLQYPFFFLALILAPVTPFWGRRLRVLLDGVLVVGAAAALSWYFLLAPIYTLSGISPAARMVSLAYPVWDLILLFGLTRLFICQIRMPGSSLTLAVFAVALVSLMFADSLVAWLLLNPQHVYRTGNLPDLFWLTFDLLVPLVCLVALRAAQEAVPLTLAPAEQPLLDERFQRHDLLASLRFMFPFLAAVLASLTITLRAAMSTTSTDRRDLLGPIAVSLGLVLLVIVRQALVYMEQEQLRRERDAALGSALALREVNRRMDMFLGIAGHELKTPLTSLQGHIELLARRVAIVRRQGVEANDYARVLDMAQTILERCDQSVHRINRLVNDLLDESRIQQGHLTFRRERGDLAQVVDEAVQEQRLLASDRTIDLELPATRPVSVRLDPDRIAQVVTNYLTNALKYSAEERPIAVRVEVEGGWARVSVRDEGVGLPEYELAHVWERFYRVEQVSVQSGSGIGLGIGLYISKSIIEGHHGQVGVRSVPGQGSVFWFTLPLAPVPPPDHGAHLSPGHPDSAQDADGTAMYSDMQKEGPA